MVSQAAAMVQLGQQRRAKAHHASALKFQGNAAHFAVRAAQMFHTTPAPCVAWTTSATKPTTVPAVAHCMQHPGSASATPKSSKGLLCFGLDDLRRTVPWLWMRLVGSERGVRRMIFLTSAPLHIVTKFCGTRAVSLMSEEEVWMLFLSLSGFATQSRGVGCGHK